MTLPAENATAPTAQLKQKKYVVAFLDFLGAKEKMTSPGECDKFLQQIYEIYQETQKLLQHYNQNVNISCIEPTVFSDNIVLAQECKSELPNNEIYSIIGFCGMFQAISMLKGVLVRGAITCGSFYKGATFVYGEALVKSHMMESEMAIYPRIIVDKGMLEKREITQNILNVECMMFKGLKRDFDGEWFVNFMTPISKHEFEKKSIEYIAAIGKLITDAFEKMDSDTPPKIIQKYCWLAKTFNALCDEFAFPNQKLLLNVNGEPVSSKLYDGLGGQALK